MVHRAGSVEAEDLRTGVQSAGGVRQVAKVFGEEWSYCLFIEEPTQLQSGDKCRDGGHRTISTMMVPIRGEPNDRWLSTSWEHLRGQDRFSVPHRPPGARRSF